MSAPLTPEGVAAAQKADAVRVRAVLDGVHGNVRAAAVALRVPRRTLDRRIVSLGLREWLTVAWPRAGRQPGGRKAGPENIAGEATTRPLPCEAIRMTAVSMAPTFPVHGPAVA